MPGEAWSALAVVWLVVLGFFWRNVLMFSVYVIGFIVGYIGYIVGAMKKGKED